MDGFAMEVTEAVCLGASLALSGICYYLYRKSRTTRDKLDGVGVLQKFPFREHMLGWNSLSRTWTDSERVLHHRVKAVLGIASALAGAAVLLWVGRRYYHLKVGWEQDRRELERLQNQNVCVICLSQPRNCVLLDCGHVCCCRSCFQALPHRQCPICQQSITQVVPIFHV